AARDFLSAHGQHAAAQPAQVSLVRQREGRHRNAMYQFSYAEIQSDSVADARDREKQILTRSIDLLIAAREKGTPSVEAAQAIHFLNRVWTAFIGDLGNEENE